MDTMQLMNIVKSLRSLEPYFRGIYACNTLPDRVRRFPSAYICNTDPIEKRAHIGSPTGSPVSTSVNFWTVLVKHQKSLTSVLETLWIAIRYCVCTTMFKCSMISLTPVDFMHCIF